MKRILIFQLLLVGFLFVEQGYSQKSSTNSRNKKMGITNKKNNKAWKPSSYIFTNKAGWVEINLPDFSTHNYKLKFLEENGNELFQIKSIRKNQLVLDKANFYHSGWFLFELYKDEALFEKNKVFLSPN